ncbi:MAG: penicillin-binding protein 2, partial [Candidatus Aureabacteria bacterium]|nr:penicillin-binding protein 2 [Candidatus Auribacterota bacterium]
EAKDILNPDMVADTISKIIQIPRERIKKSMLYPTSPLHEPSVIFSDLSMVNVIKISEQLYRLPGVDIKTFPVRHYTHDSLACHLLGYTGQITEKDYEILKDKGYNLNDEIGKIGVEEAYENYLRGTPGGRQVQVNSLGHLDKILGEKSPVKGSDIYLTLNLKMQKTLEEAFQDKKGAGIIMEVKTGNILAMTSHPSFDPNVFSTGNSEIIKQYFTDPAFPLLNKVVSGEYSPGSVYKPIMAMAGLESKTITDQTSFFCNGEFHLKNVVFKCWNKWGHGETNLSRALEQSCNVFFYNVGKEMGINPIKDMSIKFGLGAKTRIPLLGEKEGLVPSPEWKQKQMKDRYAKKWNLGDTINISIGQGYLLVTPIQMACLTAAIASRGYLPAPHLLKKVIDPNGKAVTIPVPDPPRKININVEYLDKVREGMLNVIEAKRGTGRLARLKGVHSAGKTGTVQVTKRKGEIKNVWFICFSPYENPQIAVTIFIENAESGGQDAAPVAKKVLAAWHHIPLPREKETGGEQISSESGADLDGAPPIVAMDPEEGSLQLEDESPPSSLP